MKILKMLIFLMLCSGLIFGYDYYDKVHILKISKENLFEEIKATEKQKEKLSYIFKNIAERAKKIEENLISFEEKKAKLNVLEKERYKKILEILDENQLALFNTYIINEKLIFSEKNNKIKKLYELINLSNRQKHEILRIEKNFVKKIKLIAEEKVDIFQIIQKFYNLQQEKENKINEILTDEQKEMLKNFEL